MPIATINPTSREAESTFIALTDEQIGTALARSSAAAKAWAATSFKERADLMRHAADLLGQDAERVSRLLTTEMGKPIGARKPRAWPPPGPGAPSPPPTPPPAPPVRMPPVRGPPPPRLRTDRSTRPVRT